MDPKDHKGADAASEHQVDASVEVDDSDLDVVTGGLFRGATGPTEPTGPTDPCITSIG
jgi:hypothetical protein